MFNCFLLDTHTFLWMVADDSRLQPVEKHLAVAEKLYLSVASWWEIAIKINLGKLDFDYAKLLIIADKMGLSTLAIKPQHCQRLLTLPPHHKDPFDRMLVAQAIAEDIPVLSHDELLSRYSSLVILF